MPSRETYEHGRDKHVAFFVSSKHMFVRQSCVPYSHIRLCIYQTQAYRIKLRFLASHRRGPMSSSSSWGAPRGRNFERNDAWRQGARDQRFRDWAAVESGGVPDSVRRKALKRQEQRQRQNKRLRESQAAEEEAQLAAEEARAEEERVAQAEEEARLAEEEAQAEGEEAHTEEGAPAAAHNVPRGTVGEASQVTVNSVQVMNLT